jgi:hypothetical protein
MNHLPFLVEPPVAGAEPGFVDPSFWIAPAFGTLAGSDFGLPPLLGPAAFDLLAEEACDAEEPILPADDCFVEEAGLT